MRCGGSDEREEIMSRCRSIDTSPTNSSDTDIEDIYNQIEKITNDLISELRKMRNLAKFLNDKLTEAHIMYNIEIITLKTENLKLKRRIRSNIRLCINDAENILEGIREMRKTK